MELKKGLKPQEMPVPAAMPNAATPGPLVAAAEEDTIYIDADGVMHQKNPVDSDD